MDHVALIVADVEASRHFYCDILGMTEVPRPPSFKFPGAWFKKGNAELHLVHIDGASQPPGDYPAQPTPERDIARARHHAFMVDDMDAVLARLKEHHVEIALGPRDRGGGVLQVYCFDPDRHLVEFISYPDKYANR